MGQHTIIFQKDPKVVLTNIRYTNVCTFSQDAHNAKLDIKYRCTYLNLDLYGLDTCNHYIMGYPIKVNARSCSYPYLVWSTNRLCRGERKALGHVTLMMACPIDEHRGSAVLLLMTACRSKRKEGDRMARL